MQEESLKELFLEFQKQWPIEKIKSMTLQQYTCVGNKNSFTYWIEKRLELLGSIWGGSSFKFGVYERDPQKIGTEHKKQGYTYTDKYAWYSKYGNSPESAFATVKQNIINIILFAQNNELEKIDKIDLGASYKWKIAFHYQNIKKTTILAVFKKEALNEYVSENIKSYAAIQRFIFKKKNIKNFKECLKISEEIWSKYRSNFSEEERKKISREQQREILKREENERKEIRILSRKRNSKIVTRRKEIDKYTCQNPKCAFQYQNKITEAHHLTPLYTTDELIITSVDDLVTLCPTCHRLAHYLLSSDAKRKKISENESKFTQKKELLVALSEVYSQKEKK